MKKEDKIKQKFEDNDYWGLTVSVDLYGCNPKTIRDAKKIKTFVYELCDLMEVKRFGKCLVVNFGEDERASGFSMVQLIESSLVSGHFVNKTNNVYLDFFACKYFDSKVVSNFSRDFFEAKSYIMRHNFRK